MLTKKKGRSPRHSAILAAVPVLALCTAAAAAYVSFAEEPVQLTVTSPALEVPRDLEQAFWACDYVATMYGIGATPIATCSEVTATLQAQKFAGDFGLLLEWWRQNKPMQHGRLASAYASIR